jgi:hypothetical protein
MWKSNEGAKNNVETRGGAVSQCGNLWSFVTIDIYVPLKLCRVVY